MITGMTMSGMGAWLTAMILLLFNFRQRKDEIRVERARRGGR